MKVLILDDENSKATKVKELLEKKCEIDSSCIDIVPSISDAVGKMVTTIYDLLITDMRIPDTYGSQVMEDGGLKIIQIIHEEGRILAPRNIIVLTAHRELQEKYKADIEKKSFDIIVFDDSSEEWKDKIIDKLTYLQRIEVSPGPQRKYMYDVAILTAVPREQRAVQKLGEWKRVSIEGDSTIYYETEWKNEKNTLSIVTTKLPQMGMVAAATVSMKLIANFVPRYIIMPGIAAGVKSEYEFGDIIIPREVKDYCSGKYSTPSNKQEREEAKKNPLKFFVPTASSISTDEDIFNSAMDNYEVELQRIHKAWPGHEMYKEPNIRSGYMASGDSVVQNDEVVKTMITNHLRQADGLDMEAYGMYYAARQSLTPKPIPICMKAISDFADKEKSDAHQDYAAYISANFMKYFVLNVLPNREK